MERPVHIAKWGNSLAIRLPKKLVEELQLKEGDDINIKAASEGQLFIARDSKASEAVVRMAERNWKLPEDYRFDRDEANAR
jgi:antitoxin MazE